MVALRWRELKMVRTLSSFNDRQVRDNVCNPIVSNFRPRRCGRMNAHTWLAEPSLSWMLLSCTVRQWSAWSKPAGVGEMAASKGRSADSGHGKLTDRQIATSTDGHEMRTTAHICCWDHGVSWFATSRGSSVTSPAGLPTQAVWRCTMHSVSGGCQLSFMQRRKQRGKNLRRRSETCMFNVQRGASEV